MALPGHYSCEKKGREPSEFSWIEKVLSSVLVLVLFRACDGGREATYGEEHARTITN